MTTPDTKILHERHNNLAEDVKRLSNEVRELKALVMTLTVDLKVLQSRVTLYAGGLSLLVSLVVKLAF